MQTISRSEGFINYVAPQIITVLVIGSALSILTGTLNQIHQVGPIRVWSGTLKMTMLWFIIGMSIAICQYV